MTTLHIIGAGASFPAPLYNRWFFDYYRLNPAVQFDYQSIGSGGGIANFEAGLLDFAGSDLQLKKEKVARAEASGTTYFTTRHLAAISDEFTSLVGKPMSPNWPKSLKERGALIKAATAASRRWYRRFQVPSDTCSTRTRP